MGASSAKLKLRFHIIHVQVRVRRIKRKSGRRTTSIKKRTKKRDERERCAGTIKDVAIFFTKITD